MNMFLFLGVVQLKDNKEEEEKTETKQTKQNPRNQNGTASV
jgi:hypothetical protein